MPDAKDYLLFSSSSVLNALKLSKRMFFLPSVIIYPSNACNYDCVMCTNKRSSVQKIQLMDIALMKKILKECSRFIIRPKVHISGLGEPLVYPKIKEALKLAKNLDWSMTTNGYHLDKCIIDILENRCHALNISIHGDAIEHNKITNTPGSFQKVVESIKKLDEKKRAFGRKYPLVAINCVFNNDNIQNLKKILARFQDLPINSITFQHQIFMKGDVNNKDSFVLKGFQLKALEDFLRYIKKEKFRVKINVFPKIKTNHIKHYYTADDKLFNMSCIIPWLSVRIYPDGEVQTCFRSLGNVKDLPLKKIINSNQALELRDAIRKGRFNIPYCFRCCHRHFY